MFGMMFGDTAHGAIIALAGLLLPGEALSRVTEEDLSKYHRWQPATDGAEP